MSLQTEMLQAARRAAGFLGESAPLVLDFLLRQQNPDGGFKDRAGKSDLYYTAFGLTGLAAVGDQQPGAKVQSRRVLEAFGRAGEYLRSFADGRGLGFMNLCCLARSWVALSGTEQPADSETLLKRIEGYRSADGGYHFAHDREDGTVYGAFLALGAYQDLGACLPEPLRLLESLKHLEVSEGAYINDFPTVAPRTASGATNATAAALDVLRHLGVPVSRAAADWLLARFHPQGGFLAAPGALVPDLLTTATALHTLAGLQIPLDRVKEPCLDFIDSLWTNEGGFHGDWADDHLDCEYTFYGLLALGQLIR